MLVRILVASLVAAPLLAQQPARDPIADAVASWVPVLSAPGAEDQAAASLIRGLGASWSVDRFGNLVRRVGSGTPRRVVACGLDFPSYVVSQVTSDGYLRYDANGEPLIPKPGSLKEFLRALKTGNAQYQFVHMTEDMLSKDARIAKLDEFNVEECMLYPGEHNSVPGYLDGEALHVVQHAYNQYLVDEWGGFNDKGRINLTPIIPLEDLGLAVREVDFALKTGARAVMMPLGPEFTRLFAISDAQFGLLVSAYTLAAGTSGVIASFFVDRFERKRLLLWMYALFALATLACGLAPTYGLLMSARLAAGLFGGVMGALVQTIVADAIPFESRDGTRVPRAALEKSDIAA